MEKIVFTRRQLYDLVWSTRMLTLAKKYEISDSGLRKICRRMNIPIPQVGYWQKLQHKKRAHRYALPSVNLGQDEIAFNIRSEHPEDSRCPQMPITILRKAIEHDSPVAIRVPQKLTNPGKLIIQAKAILGKQTPERWHQMKGLVNGAGQGLDIRVTPKNIGRALRFMDTLIKALETRGHRVVVRNHTYAVVHDYEFRIFFREKTKKVLVVPNGWSEFHPTGVLFFRIEGYHGREWVDGRKLVESKLSGIIAKLETEGLKEKAWRIDRDEREKIWKAKERQERELKELKEIELKNFQNLIQEFRRWREAADLRTYLTIVETQAHLNQTWTEEIQRWLIWARAKADWYDPLIKRTDELLREFAEFNEKNET
jgi:hypothetical protein